jgi:hypothetical protein
VAGGRVAGPEGGGAVDAEAAVAALEQHRVPLPDYPLLVYCNYCCDIIVMSIIVIIVIIIINSAEPSSTRVAQLSRPLKGMLPCFDDNSNDEDGDRGDADDDAVAPSALRCVDTK